jgi:hypothetical protein
MNHRHSLRHIRRTEVKNLTSSPDHRGSWLTARRLRAHGFLLALTLWSFYVWTLATPELRDRNGNLKGTDFLHFYTLGSLALAHRGGDLYDLNEQTSLVAQRVPEAAGIRYLPLYPPQVSLLFAPLAYLSYGWALAVWWLSSAAIYAACCYVIWRACPQLREYGGTVALLAAAFPAFFHLIAWGQTSAIALACFTAMFFLLRKRRDFLAGLALGCLIFKPQLGLAAAIVFLAVGSWKIVGGAVISAALQLGAGILYFGMQPLRAWSRVLWNVPTSLPLLEPRPYQTHCLRTFWTMLIPWPVLSLALYLVSAALILGLTIATWRRTDSPLGLRYSLLLLATVLVAPHLTVYDLVILVPAILLLADWLIAHSTSRFTERAGTLLYLIYILPLLGPFTRWTHIQLSVVAMFVLAWTMWRLSQVHVSVGSAAQVVGSH